MRKQASVTTGDLSKEEGTLDQHWVRTYTGQQLRAVLPIGCMASILDLLQDFDPICSSQDLK